MNSSNPCLVFMGTPLFAVPTLKALLESNGYHIAAVITQPDKPAHRGQKLTAPLVKEVALQYGLQVFQPSSIKKIEVEETDDKDGVGRKKLISRGKNSGLTDFLNQLPSIDAFIAVAYGKIIPSSLLQYGHLGVINIHPSLLPRWRGAAPIQYAVFSGDMKTGVSLMKIDEGLDTGPVYCQAELALDSRDTFGSLHDSLAELGAKLLLDKLPSILSEELKPQPQQEDGATYAHKWEKSDATIRWDESADITTRRIRASNPRPGCRTSLQGDSTKILEAHPVLDRGYPNAEPGTIVEANSKELVVATGHFQYLSVDRMQFPGRKALSIEEIVKGYNFRVGERFS